MGVLIKPILYNGFKVKDAIAVQSRVERVFFTEVYLLSNQEFLYLFTNPKPEEIFGRTTKYDLLIIEVAGAKYLGVITKEHTHEKIRQIIDDLTVLRGFDCVAGMKELKNLLLSEVIEPLLHPEKFRKFRLGIPNGILLFGPPGCGKTFIVKKLAEELNYNFVEIAPSSIGSPYIHGTVGKIGKAFEIARLKAPTVIFVDEIEALVPKREDLDASSELKKEEINEFLIQLNNAGHNKILVIGATNRPHMIDSAILRSGRMDKRIYVGAPDFEARRDMFKMCLSGRPYDKSIDFERLAMMTENYVSSDLELIVTEAARSAVSQGKDMVNEQMLINAIEKCLPSITKEEIRYYEQFIDLQRF